MQHVQRYEVIERIAVGGMAEVFLARAHGQHGFHKDVAIKRILPKLAASPAFERRFIAEAKLAVSLGHANIVQVFDFGRDDSSLFIAMEFVRGANLAQLLAAAADARTQLPLPAVLHIAISIAHGLELAHSRGVIHRDLSPSNVLLSVAGEVKIADFGIAKPLDEESAHKGVVGKWAYMAPEQARGERLDRRSDLFSLGVILHELVTAKRLFRRDHWEQTLAALLNDPIEAPSRHRADLPPALDAVVVKALARDPAARFASAAELSRALSEACIAAHIVHTPDDVARVLASFHFQEPANSQARTMSTASILDEPIHTLVRQDAATAGSELTHWHAGTADTVSSAVGVKQTPRSRPSIWIAASLGVLAAGVLGLMLTRSNDDSPTPIKQPVAAAPTLDAAAAVTADAEVAVDDATVAAKHEPAVKPVPRDDVRAVDRAPRFGTIDIQALPWAHVYVAGKRRGTTPLKGLRLPVGQHQVTLVNPEAGIRRTVTVRVPHAEPYSFRLTE